MSYYTGSGSICQMGKESTFGTAVTPSTLVNMTSESITETVTKSEEGSLLASKTATSKDIMSINVAGSVSFILRPEFAGDILYAAMGKEGTVTAVGENQKHTFTLADVNADLPSYTFVVGRGAAVKRYAGCTIGSLSLEASAGDYVKGSVSLVGVGEATGTINESKKSFSIPSFRCTGATCTFAGQTLDITGATVEINNALENAPQTYSSGLYAGQPQHGQRSVSVTLNALYTSTVDGFRETYLKTETGASVVLTYKSSNDDYQLKITIPCMSIEGVSGNVSGTGAITSSITGTALFNGTDEPITIELQDKTENKYGA